MERRVWRGRMDRKGGYGRGVGGMERRVWKGVGRDG